MAALSALLTNVSFLIQNVNSLNISTTCPKQSEKICSLIDTEVDIIFLSDLRLNNSKGIKDIEKSFLACKKQYKFYHNSTMAKRGSVYSLAVN